jgi:hypothetical protein
MCRKRTSIILQFLTMDKADVEVYKARGVKHRLVVIIVIQAILVLFLLAPIGLSKLIKFTMEDSVVMLTLVVFSITLSMLSYSIAPTEDEEERNEYKLSGMLFAISGIMWFMVSISVYSLSGEAIIQPALWIYIKIFTILMISSIGIFTFALAAILLLLISGIYYSPAARDLIDTIRTKMNEKDG